MKDFSELGYACLVLNFQFAWYVYGNTFHYTAQAMECRQLNPQMEQLWTLMMVIIAFGYLYFVVYGIVCCVLSCICCCVMCMAPGQGNNTQEMVARIPYAQTIAGLNKKSFGNVREQAKNMKECVICSLEYKDDDTIAELKCDERHYFHQECLEEWLKRKLECPLCKKPVQP